MAEYLGACLLPPDIVRPSHTHPTAEPQLQPYVVLQGEYLAMLAYKLGFDANAVWNDPKNQQLRDAGKLSQDPNVLWPTDVIYIPDENANALAAYSLTPGTTNTFVTAAVNVTVSLKFTDKNLASQAYSIQELPELGVRTSGADGIISFSVPVTLRVATIVFNDPGAQYECKIGGLDPIDKFSGIFQRLQHLGYVATDEILDRSKIDLVRSALRALKAEQAGPRDVSSSSSGSDDDAPLSAPCPGSDPSPLSDESDSDAPSSIGAGGNAPPSAPDPDTSQSSSSATSASVPDNGGLNDDGTLDDETRALLLKVHGS
ncbi:MAG: hypothetical protein ABTD50_04870 [Polyangiaceae bacterium]